MQPLADLAPPIAAQPRYSAVVAIPARDEAERIGACLDALADAAAQAGPVAVLLLADRCADATVEIATAARARVPYALVVVRRVLVGSALRNAGDAGGARRAAMDAGAALLAPDGVLMTTDADTRVAPDWIARNRAAIAAGADAAAGRVTYLRADDRALPQAARRRERLERIYARLLAELRARARPDPHDPWPRHDMASGASLALTLDAYRRIGGLPRVPVGEDRALVDALRAAGARVRHCPRIRVTTSGRLDGRASAGAAATRRLRAEGGDPFCGPDLPALDDALACLAGVRMRAQARLCASALPGEIERAGALVRMLRLRSAGACRGDNPVPARSGLR
ncbi:glycosyltransferase [Salinarimonas ramus]|uniref:Glycosyl transferase family 2 n=1 Tax=Salinarimonas ramus TaxID=690164 RepID=A0A917QA33_9HYPH|nr:glycosyltransferase [Salinarimonas ramus]GGK39421.1 hypothetical protein GCM10011322_28170 [Salinarimonas ramus]